MTVAALDHDRFKVNHSWSFWDPALSQKLAATAGGRFLDRRAPHAATLPPSSRRLDAGAAAASLLAHGGLLLAIALLDPHSNFPVLAREIPVELVSEPAAPEKR
jgi:hypothetical protein